MSGKRNLEAIFAATTVLALGLTSITFTAKYVILHGLDASFIFAEIFGVVYTLLLSIVAYFDFKGKPRAFVISVFLAGLFVARTLSGLGEGLATNLGVSDLILVIVSLMAIITSMLAYSSRVAITRTTEK